MTIQTFINKRGMVYGKDPKRICCSTKGVLKIGSTEIPVSSNESIMPLLFNGGTGDYDATFTDICGTVYNLDKVAVRGGRIVPPSQTDVEIMELRCRADIAERECEALREELRELRNIFDTNSLNFLIR
jgi:hypothetical protein